MQVSVVSSSGIPEGSILSIRAGTMRRQGNLNTDKPMVFPTGMLQANPFKVDIFAPLASSRLTLTPTNQSYNVSFDGQSGMELSLDIQEEAKATLDGLSTSPARQAKREKAATDTQAYIEAHQLVQFVQNLMQSVLADKPDEPLLYMQDHLRAAMGLPPEARGVPKASPNGDTVMGRGNFANSASPNGAAGIQLASPSKRVNCMKPPPSTAHADLHPTSGKNFSGPAFVVEDAAGNVITMRPLTQTDITSSNAETRRLIVPHLSDSFQKRQFGTPLVLSAANYKTPDDWVLQTLLLSREVGSKRCDYQMLCAGARKNVHWRSKDVVAAVVICGALSPGVNAVIRELVMMLYMYGVTKVYGIKGGFRGLEQPDRWLELSPQVVQDIHEQGGSILMSDHGFPEDAEGIVQQVIDFNVKHFYVVGGDGALRGTHDMHERFKKKGWECSVVAVPKTLDNDIPMLDRTSGFDTACTEAKKAVDTAYTESTCNSNCIGLVKLMGKTGFIAMNACLAARNVDMCLLPEMDLDINKILNQTLELMQTKESVVIVISEGCFKTLMPDGVSNNEESKDSRAQMPDVGIYLRDRIMQRCREVKLPLSIKYIDPTYMIRAVPPNSYDSVYCTILAHNAVHAAMAGYTDVTAGRVQMRYVLLPIESLIKNKSNRVDTRGRWFQRLVSLTRQPSFLPDESADGPPKSSIKDPNSVNNGVLLRSERMTFSDIFQDGDEIRRVVPGHLKDNFGVKELPTTLAVDEVTFLGDQSWVCQTIGTGGTLNRRGKVRLQMLRSGPRKVLHFNPSEVAAAIVTCGGLCPGLNSVIRECVMMLYSYGVKKVYGIKGGFKGVVEPHKWLTLTPESVCDIHMYGGTILVSDRGNPPPDVMAQSLKKKGVNQFFIVGGDGTHRGAKKTYDAMMALGWECSVIGVPKTIDNDINVLDRTFGFDTACTEAEKAISTAYTEATCNANCIGLVRLMGRHCGFIAMHACLAARYVDICLLPEMDISLARVLEYSTKLLKEQGYAVIVVAEGCGEQLMANVTDGVEYDEGGNKKLADPGIFLRQQLTSHFKEQKLPLTVKYIDPTYMVRAVPANANDSIYCSILAHGAVDGAMAGYTGITTGKVDERFVYLPMRLITEARNKKVDVKSSWYERLIATTQQPHLGVQGAADAAPIDPEKVGRIPMIRRSPTIRSSRMFRMSEDLGDEVRVPQTKLTLMNGFGEVVHTRELRRSDLIKRDDDIRSLTCFHLSDRFGEQSIPTPLKSKSAVRFMDNFSWATQTLCTKDAAVAQKTVRYYQMTLAGPRQILHFDPNDPAACALIVSCGGICPGLNSVIREVVNSLWSYGVRKIYGARGGYKGVVEPHQWIRMNPNIVQEIHMKGGTMLVSDRGHPDHSVIAKVLKEKNVRQYFVLGGDGTHKGAMETFECCLAEEHECAVVGVPKTIDNDVPMMDQTFGFDSACTEAVKAVQSAYTESISNANCIGLVKLMGRHCGHIALISALAAGHVDVCLLPEMSIDMSKVLKFIAEVMQRTGHCVVLVAEGCGDTIISDDSGATDAGGNKKLADVGPYVNNAIKSHFKKLGIPLTVKFIDPTYMIRSVPPSSYDSIYCSVLAQNAVHAAMAGYSGITVGKVHEKFVYLPIYTITKQKGKRVDTGGRWFLRLAHSTGQPDFTPDILAGNMTAPTEVEDVTALLSNERSVNSILHVGDEIKRLDVCSLGNTYESKFLPNPCLDAEPSVAMNSWTTQAFSQFNKRDDCGHSYFQMLRAGAREHLHFDPAESKAAIVTCGGLCPGLNSVIREIVVMLNRYGVNTIYGIRGGYKGVLDTSSWINLTYSVVKDIQVQGGTILVSDRGNPPHSQIAQSLKDMGIKQYFVLGGDGTHKGIMETFDAMTEMGYECACVGVPKTIDNDIPMVDRTFGFNTACSVAQQVIDSAYVEASCNANCIGLVKLMGRHCGFIAMGATLAARHVDVCLLPEMSISLPKVLKYCLQVMRTKRQMVVVVAEGCGDTLLQSAGSEDVDGGGHKKMADVGPWLADHLYRYFKRMQVPLSIKYIDPTYMIRAVPANANDNVFCTVLGQYAVHAAMAGLTGCTIGRVDERYVILPIHAITQSNPARRVDMRGRDFERMLQTTRQPDFTPGPGDDWALLPAAPPGRLKTPSIMPERRIEALNIREWSGLPPFAPEPEVQEDVLPDTKLKVFSGIGEVLSDRELHRTDLICATEQVRRLLIVNLSQTFTSKQVLSPFKAYTKVFQDEDSWSMPAFTLGTRIEMAKGTPNCQMLSAGPRRILHFDPRDPDACAVVMNCGDLCPGLNAAIREIVMVLHDYGVERVYGVRAGFRGLVDPESWISLTPELVYDIHLHGGSILATDHGCPPIEELANVLAQNNVRQCFCLGGDGTQDGALQISTQLLNMNYPCAVVGIPKTIDNNLPNMDKTFGFDTAITEARKAIDAAYVEATCNANCIGLVKLIGKDSGFITITAALSARVVDICLFPEMDISMDKVLDHCVNIMRRQKYAVVVVGEGCFADVTEGEGGDRKHVDAGTYLRDEILTHFKTKGIPLTIKYIDPTYMVRAVPANANDSLYVSVLAEHAVHGAMAGYTAITVAKVFNKYVYLPTAALQCQPCKRVNTKGRLAAELFFNTQQPSFEPEGHVECNVLEDLTPLIPISTPVRLKDFMNPGTEVHRYELMNLGMKFQSKAIENPLQQKIACPKLFVSTDKWTTEAFKRLNNDDTTGRKYLQMLRSGPREVIHFDPTEPDVCAAIVTCGGICPGLNSVIREVVKMLQAYGVKSIKGIIGGYKGCVLPDTWMDLNNEVVQDIHMQGGSILVSDRGNPAHIDIARSLQKQGVRWYFVLGGDGTHKGAMETYDAMQRLEIPHECAVIGIPKTIDNDIQILDTSFGYDTACTEAENAIDSAFVEATTNANCIGMVKLMGRHCGFIATQASTAARHVDICLIPEMTVDMQKLLDYCVAVMKKKSHAVIVVAEGCGDTLISSGEAGTDAGGNKLLADVGPYLRDSVLGHFKKLGIPLTIKYIDPTYMIRSVPANAYDSVYCSRLAQDAVHGAMAGYTGITVGKVDERYVMLPVHAITGKGQRTVDINGRMFEQLIATTRQPSFAP